MTVASLALLLAAAQSNPLPPESQGAPLIIDQGRADRAQPMLPPPALKPDDQTTVATQLSTVDARGVETPIKGIAFEGVKVPAPVAEAASGFLGHPATRATLEALAAKLSIAYERTGIALYTIAIPDQDLSSGHIRVTVAEGFIEDIVYPKGASPLIHAYGERLRQERPLTRRTLERTLSLMRDIPGAKIDADLQRGKQAGGVVIVITPRRRHSDFALGVDNRATQGLGSGQFRGEAHGYSLLRDGDRTDLTLLSATDLRRFRYAALAHATPLGADGLSLALSGGYLETRPSDQPVRGEAATAGLSLSYPIIRGYRRNLSMSIGLDGINSDAAAFGALISSDHMRAARLAVGYSSVAKETVTTAGATITRGLGILGARGTPGFTDTVFTKANARATIDRALGKRIVARLRASGQWSRDRLTASERFAVGGSEFGRAFDAAILSGDSGFAGLGELAIRPKLPADWNGSELYGFIDGARIYINERLPYAAADYGLASAGGGVRLSYAGKASLEIEGAKVIDHPYPTDRSDWRVNLAWRLALRKP
ncbi:MAG: ShlB/FhaC/HecB family hemolysin secretion/activation protein [Candidatus Sphingomonas colombiensis]|nr:ShlB/FhaC/HecB family hemolysin secretion/activation protein [Sphingomonas sp.]WEK42114.1 MAG: ShlB/FhaC/HecB family hemolysin secretion/activation protein [Sphingomonas sp.]